MHDGAQYRAKLHFSPKYFCLCFAFRINEKTKNFDLWSPFWTTEIHYESLIIPFERAFLIVEITQEAQSLRLNVYNLV